MTFPEGFTPEELSKVVIDGREVTLDPTHLIFNEQTVHKWQQDAQTWDNFYSQVQFEAEKWCTELEEDYDTLFDTSYLDAKANGCTEKQAEATSRISQAVRDAKHKLDDAKWTLGKIKAFIRSFDKAFDTARSMEYRLGKELDKVVRSTGDWHSGRDPDLEAKVDEIIRGSSENHNPLA